ncbi:energy transducer TonB [Algoriphagus halophytocola]|uniref:Energy transducer TonB n=1 Tax=Algoriphagus halophytocola TaxID=2991499 RepID=A0ABY6MJF8_9BACT|nr:MULTISPECIES: energy transducer TonB [unclassified Algoriphagus]UZD23778.1 energy transducer TonB [Algoriphagus sp. TR-M5]WBL45072.1 energy transducer TonB [Algoriphagus sp. TR-M9]
MQTWNADKIERDSKKKSWIITIVLNLLLLLAFYFIVVWKQPVPPLPTFGLELNLGFTETGSGERNSPNAPSETPTPVVEAAAPGEIAPEITKPATPAPSPKTETAKPKAQTQPAVNKAVTTKPSPIKGEEKATEQAKKPEPVKTEPAKPVNTPAKAEAEKTEQKAPEQPKIDQRAIFGAGGNSGQGKTPASGGAQGSSKEKGDEGDPKGTVDGRAIMGVGSGKGESSGAGYSLDLAGWDFAAKPNINDRVSTRNGRIVFKITIDDGGRVVQAVPLEYNVSNEVLAYYRQVVNQIAFKKQGGAAAEFSTGKITFIIKVD